MFKLIKTFDEENLAKQLDSLEKQYPNMIVTYTTCPYFTQMNSGTISKVYHCVMVRT